jgi:hypothetical protein
VRAHGYVDNQAAEGDSRLLLSGRGMLPRVVDVLVICTGIFLFLAAGSALSRPLGKYSVVRVDHQSMPVPRGMTLGVGNVQNCISDGANPVPTLKRYRLKWFHEVVPPYANPTVPARCFAAAAAAGYRLSVAVQYNNSWSTAQDQAWFNTVMGAIGPSVSEVSIGNEQELWTGGQPQKPSVYAKTWRAVEPIVRRYAPHALIGAGEISPWGESFLKAAWKIGLPGAQLIAAHPYRKPGNFTISELLGWAHKHKRPLWFTEGLLLPPRSWGVSVRPVKLVGASYAFGWLADT